VKLGGVVDSCGGGVFVMLTVTVWFYLNVYPATPAYTTMS